MVAQNTIESEKNQRTKFLVFSLLLLCTFCFPVLDTISVKNLEKKVCQTRRQKLTHNKYTVLVELVIKPNCTLSVFAAKRSKVPLEGL